MIRLAPVEARTGGDEDLLFLQKIERHLLVAVDIEFLRVHLRENVKRRFRLGSAQAGDGVERFPDQLTLLVKPSAGAEIFVHRLIAAERGLDDALRRNVGAKAHFGKKIQPLDISLGVGLITGETHPADAEARNAVGFGKAVEAERQKVGRERGERDVLRFSLHDETVVDLVGKEDKVVLAGNLHDLLKDLLRIERAGRVVRVDDDDALRARRDLGSKIVDIGVPVLLLVAEIVYRLAAGERDGRRPERIIRRGDKDLVAVVQKALHGERDELTHAVAGKDVVDADIRNALELAVLHDRLAGGEETAGIGIALAVAQVIDHVENDLVRRIEAEGGGIADVELEYIRAARFHAHGLVHYGTADVVADVVELFGLLVISLFHGISPFRKNENAPSQTAQGGKYSVLPPEFGQNVRTLPGTAYRFSV